MVKQATPVKSDYNDMMADYLTVCRRCSATGDYDPFLPMLYYLERDMGPEEALWYSCLFIAYYNPGSAWVAFHSCRDVLEFPRVWDLPLETARRALQGGRVRVHLEQLIHDAKRAGGLRKLYTRGFGPSKTQNWHTLQDNIRSLYGCGRWVGYIFGGILRKVHGFRVTQTDMGNKGSSGPKNGLILLTDQDTDEAAEELLDWTRANVGEIDWREHRHVPDPDFDFGVQESTTCDFNSMNKGRYYLGRDIDRDQYRIRRAERYIGETLTPLWDARATVFPHQYLGELNRWEGIEADRLKHYVRTGEVIDR